MRKSLLFLLAVALSACGGHSPGDNAVPVDVTQVWDASAGMYAEGSYSYIRVERPDGGSLLEERFDEEGTLHLRLDPGTYRFGAFSGRATVTAIRLTPQPMSVGA